MTTRTVENIEHGIVGTHNNIGERLGWMAANVQLDDEGNRRGTMVELSVGKIVSDHVAIIETVLAEDDVVEGRHEKVKGVGEPHLGYAYFDQEGKIMDWNGVGFSRDQSSSSNSWRSFSRAYQQKRVLGEGKWAVGDDKILGELKTNIAANSESPEQAENIYTAMYIRFNRLIADSYRNQFKQGGQRPQPLHEILLIDPDMTEHMQAEMDKAQTYQNFTADHISKDTSIKKLLEAGVALTDLPNVTSQFVAAREAIKESHSRIYETCESMHDSIYMPSGFRFGAGRTWPYMDIADYGREVRLLEANNLPAVIAELSSEIRELDHKLRELINPHITVLRALAGDKQATLYG